jgi:hypothetical protein
LNTIWEFDLPLKPRLDRTELVLFVVGLIFITLQAVGSITNLHFGSILTVFFGAAVLLLSFTIMIHQANRYNQKQSKNPS